MKRTKERLTVTVDRALIRAGNRAVSAGQAQSLSGWVNLALSERAAKERRLVAMAEAISAYEHEHGEISAEEMEEQERADRRAAVVVKKRTAPRRRKASAA